MKEYEIHRFAGIVPMATDVEQKCLQDDIEERGQIANAVLYKGKIIDGRCRYKACQELGIELKVESLPHNTSLEDAASFVFSSNTRRNQTATQKALTAYRWWLSLNNKITIKSAISKWGVSRSNFDSAKFVSERSPILAEMMYNDKIIEYTRQGGETERTRSAAVLHKWLKADLDKVNFKSNSTLEQGYADSERFKCHQAKVDFASTMAYVTDKNGKLSQRRVEKAIVDLCNSKYSEVNENEF